MSIQVVPIADAHIESFRACLDSVAREKKYVAQIEAMPLEQVSVFVKGSIANDVAQFVATEGALVVGWCDIFPSWAHAVQHCGTLGMGVLSAYRGRGIGKQLLTACLAKARSKGITRVELEARADNVVAIQLYQKLGFTHEATKRNAMRFDGRYYDSVQMSLIYE
jgi:ribosomal protein S18 acetylase RimI-like enzyme